MAQVVYKKQLQMLDFLRQYLQRHQRAPRLREIADALNLSSLATVHEHLSNLEKRGLIKRSYDGNIRELQITAFEYPRSPDGIEVPVLGYIAAGLPLEPHTDPNASLNIPGNFASSKKRIYVLQVKGDSLIEEAIRDGDFVVIEQTEKAINGDIVVALLNNGMATLKRFFKEETRIRLEPANSSMNPMFVRSVRIQGKVVGLIRKYRN